MDDLTPRLRAICDLQVADVREYSGRHEYDGQVQDLSRAGVRAGLQKLAAATRDDPPLDDPHDEAQLSASVRNAHVALGDIELHRRDPAVHLASLDLACYDRDYAPQDQRDRARAAHLAGWPHAIEGALDALDQVSAPVAEALRDAIRGLAAGIPSALTNMLARQHWPRMRGWSPGSTRPRRPGAPMPLSGAPRWPP